jgi:hypothetical protein
MKFWNLAVILIIGILPAPGRADDPTTAPSDATTPAPPFPNDRPYRFRNGFDGGYGARFYGPGRYGRGVTPEERDEVSAFMKQHSPERFKAISNLPERLQQQLMMEAVNNWRNYQRVKIDQPELAQMMVYRVELEDETYKLVNQIRTERSGDPQAAQADNQLLKDKIGLLIDTNIKERQLRIARLQKTLQSEQDLLARDSLHRDDLVERRLHAFLGAADINPPDQGATTRPATQP